MLAPEVSRAGAAAVNATDDCTERETLRDALISLDGKLEIIGRDHLPRRPERPSGGRGQSFTRNGNH